ncbi:tetratricopeptide repeat protein [Parahaliea maris]|uniref:Tetratricopeptide repeat protein n=1 Tax=Parahaliea maris TaxID=2716870 RepID=A0A5C9A761_9GAMM|nr:winged helix-turn-helix domain-containing protein [Parahaliea maris]TXS95939.1 tetratricopeptide repeat protein [Parahaliea maris]
MGVSHEFGPWQFDVDTGDLTRAGDVVRLEPTVARVLDYMLSNQDRLITRAELIEQVWRNRVVSDDSINRAISILRQSLDREQRDAYIKTLPRRGYRASFPPPQRAPTPPPAAAAEETVPETPPLELVTETATAAPVRTQSARWAAYGAVTAVLIAFLLTYPWRNTDSPAPAAATLAVLPFQELGGEQEPKYLGEGISDWIILRLADVNELQVTARTSSFSLRNRGMTIEQIAEALNVSHVLEGSVQKQGDRLRVIARLIRGDSEREVWSNSFDRNIDELFSIQDDIAHAIVASLKGTLLRGEKDEYEPTAASFQLTLRGRQAYNRHTQAGYLDATQYLEEAVAADPEYALPHLLLAKTLRASIHADSVVHIYPSGEREAILASITQHLDTALRLDPILSEAHALRAQILQQRGEEAAAEDAFQQALEFGPNNPEVLADYARWLSERQRNEESLVVLRRAAAQDPRNNRLQQLLGRVLWGMGLAEQAVAVIEENLRIHPDAANNLSLLARWHMQLGEPGQSMLYYMAERDLDPDNPHRQWAVCLMHWQLWDNATALRCIDHLLADHPDYYEARKWQAELQGDHARATEIVLEQIERYPDVQYYKLQLLSLYTAQARWQAIIALARETFPELTERPPKINDINIWAARELATALARTGQDQAMRELSQASLQHIDRTRKLQRGGYTTGIDDLVFLALLGRTEEAFERLEAAIDQRFSFYSQVILLAPEPIDTLRGPRLEALIDRQRAFLESERRWYQQQLAQRMP